MPLQVCWNVINFCAPTSLHRPLLLYSTIKVAFGFQCFISPSVLIWSIWIEILIDIKFNENESNLMIDKQIFMMIFAIFLYTYIFYDYKNYGRTKKTAKHSRRLFRSWKRINLGFPFYVPAYIVITSVPYLCSSK